MGGERHLKSLLALCGLLLIARFTAPAAESSAPAPFFPPHATVVLFPGLPGDIESEKNYRDQLQGWLEILESAPAAPQQVFVFADTNSAAPASTLPVRFLKPSREEFVTLGNNLAAQTNPIVLIVWGHGGMQSSTPVFHVAGPRLKPADFKAFAAQISGTESHWLLLFRGSGSFAAALVADRHLIGADRRLIIASENETMFTSDPVGMPLALKAVRANPAISLSSLASDLGRSTAAWYKDRNLARTEEPTLWLVGAARILAPVEADAASKPAEEKSAPETSAASTNLPAAWKDIARVEPQKYPGADGVILRRRMDYTIGGSPALASETEEFIQVLTAEGKHLGDFDFSYSPPYENITFLDCEILRPDGKLLRLDPDQIREAAETPLGDYQAARRKIFSLPGVAPGAVLRVHYQNDWKTFPMPHVSLTIPLVSELPVLDSSVQISLPKDSAFHFAFDQFAAADPAVKQSAYGSEYSWRFQDLPADEHEALSPPTRGPALLISTFPDWDDFTGWYTRISQLADTVTPEISAKATELTADAKTDRERAVLLCNYVTSLRYVAVPLGVNSFRPHAAANVLQNQYGDCKDKANLFNTLLRSLNINASLVLVPRFTQARDSLPGFAFNHAISRVSLGDETIWVDTTDDVCRFGMLPPGDPGRKVLVLDGKSHSLTQLPPPTPNAHQLKIHARVNLSGGADDSPVVLDATASGFPDYELRSAAQHIKPGNTTQPLLATTFRPASGAFGLEKQNHSPVSTLTDDFTWQAEGAFSGILFTMADKRRLRAPFWLPREWDAALNRRKTPLFLNQGYPLLLDEEFEFSLPSNSREITLPPATENSSGPLAWKIAWDKTGDAAVTARLRVELAGGELSALETPAFQKQLRELLSALGAEAAFALPP